jgi:diketogulonate reductase-like aldo/keto reductase
MLWRLDTDTLILLSCMAMNRMWVEQYRKVDPKRRDLHHYKGLEELPRKWFDAASVWGELATARAIVHRPLSNPLAGRRVRRRDMESYDKVMHQGKARVIGVSNYSVSQINDLLQNSDIIPAVNQIEFHHFLYQKELLRFARIIKISLRLIAHWPEERGSTHPNIVGLTKKYDKTSAQVLIRWSLQHDLVVIPKSTHEAWIKENSQVFDFQLEANDMKLLDSLNENLYTVFMD